MKRCEYCGSKVADDVLQCSSCNSREFKNICDHCGEETLEEVCPKCRIDSINKQPVQTHNHFMPKGKPKKKKGILIAALLLVFIAGVFGVVSSQKAVNKLSDLEVLNLEGHPRYYDDFSEAKKTWHGYGNVKVVNAHQTVYYEDALLLITTGDGNHNMITNVTINLSDYERKQDLKLEDVLKTVCGYIPYDDIDKYYTFKESFHETYKEGDYEAYHYIMEINDEGRAVNKSGQRYLLSKFAFKIVHRKDDAWVAEMNISAYEGNHDKFAPEAYDVEEWDVDIDKYR